MIWLSAIALLSANKLVEQVQVVVHDGTMFLSLMTKSNTDSLIMVEFCHVIVSVHRLDYTWTSPIDLIGLINFMTGENITV